MPKLTSLECEENQLTELDLSNVPNLTTLWCYQNQLTELDLSSVPGLTTLYCSANQMSKLELSAVPNLVNLHCETNLITELDVTANTALTELHCDGSVRVVKLPDQKFNRYPPTPMRYWFDEGNNTLFQTRGVLRRTAGDHRITQEDFEEYVAIMREEEAKGIGGNDE